MNSLNIQNPSGQLSRILSMGCLSLALFGCGGGSAPTATSTAPIAETPPPAAASPGPTTPVEVAKPLNPVSVVPALGGFGAGAVVQFLKVNGDIIANGTTNANGVAILDMGTYSGPFISSVTGGPNVTFYNEKTQTREPFGTNDRLLAIAPAVPTGTAPRLGITQLTNAAASVLISDPAKPSFTAGISEAEVKSQISVANATVAVAAGLPEGLDILSAPRALTSSLDRISSSNANEAAYGAIIAALAQAGSGASAMEGARAMAADAKANKGALPASATLLQSAAANLTNLVNTFVDTSSNSTNLKGLVAKVNPDPVFSRPESKAMVSTVAVAQNGGKALVTVIDLPATTTKPVTGGGASASGGASSGGAAGGGGAVAATVTTSGAITSIACPTNVTGTVISVVPGLGLISDGANVTAFNPTDGTQISTATTSKGFACLSLGLYKGPFILKLSGANGGSYYDAGLGGPVAMDSGEALLALVPTDTTNGTKSGSSFGINALSHMGAAFAGVSASQLVITPLANKTISDSMYEAIARTRLAMGLPVDVTKISLTHNLNSLIAQEVTSAAVKTIDISKPGGYMGLFLAELASATVVNSTRTLLALSKSLASEANKYVVAANKTTAATAFLGTKDAAEIRKALIAVSAGASAFKNSCYSIPATDNALITSSFSQAEKSLNINPTAGQLSEAIAVDKTALTHQNNGLVYTFSATKANGCP